LTYVQEKAGPEAAGRREAGGGGGRQGTVITLILYVLKVRLDWDPRFFSASVSGSRARFYDEIIYRITVEKIIIFVISNLQ
jgi:hypothetical protein